jgi:hypothetical protein
MDPDHHRDCGQEQFDHDPDCAHQHAPGTRERGSRRSVDERRRHQYEQGEADAQHVATKAPDDERMTELVRKLSATDSSTATRADSAG